MPRLRLLSASEQVAGHLREELLRGRWSGTMPGEHRLVAELGVSHDTVKEALRHMEKEGLLVSQGPGKRRRIAPLPDKTETPPVRVRIMPYEPEDRKVDYFVDLGHRLREEGHVADFAKKTLTEMGMDVKRVARFVERNPADAWVVMSGSREVLDWFASRPTPAFALAGRFLSVPIAGMSPKKAPALVDAIRLMVAHGHRRVVMLAREESRKPEPGFLESVFLKELETCGIPVGAYSLPDWQDDVAGLHRILDSLFQHTPPTALIMGEGPLFLAARQHLAQRGILAPRDVSMVSMDPDLGFGWYDPPISHIRWDAEPILRRIVRWADSVARGREDRRQTTCKAELVQGKTIGQAKGTRRNPHLT